MAFVPQSGSVVAFQSDPTKLVGTFSVVGTVTATASGNQSVSGAVTAPAGSIATVVNPAGSVTAVSATQATSPWVVAPNNSSMFALQVAGSIMAVDATFTPPANQSVSGTVGSSIIGLTPVAVTNTPSISGTVQISTAQGAVEVLGSGVDDVNNATNETVTAAMGYVFNGGTWDRLRGNSSVGAVVTTGASSVITLQLAGSILATSATLTPGSVSGAVTAPPGSIMAVSATAPAGSVMTVANLAGSIAAVTATVTGNPSVSGTVNVGNFPTTQNVSGSVVAFQGTAEWTVKSSIAGGIFPISGSVAAVVVGTPNVNTAGSVVAFQGTSPWAVTNGGSIITVDQGSSVIAYQLAGSILATSASITPAANQSVSGAVTAPPGSIMAVSAIQPAGSIMAVTATQPAGSLLSAIQVAGSVMAVSATQGTSPWLTNQGGSVITVWQSSSVIAIVTGSVATRGIAGSIMSVTNPAGSVTAVQGSYQEETVGGPSIKGIAIVWESNANTSVMSTVSPTNPLRVLGSVSGAITNPPGSITQVSGATTTTAGSIISTTNPAGSVTAVSGISFSLSSVVVVAGSIITVPTGSVITVFQSSSVVAILQSSSIIARVTGSVATLGTAGSIMSVAIPAGSITAVSGATTTTAGSIISTANPAGSVTAVIWQAPSIVGTYAEDSAHATAANGLFILGVRNDLLASVTGADLDYSPISTGPIGESIVANAPITKWISGQSSVMAGPSVQVIAAQGASIFTYITGVQIVNDGTVTSRVKLTGGLGSVLAFTIAPAAGGSNIVFPNPLRTGENSGFSASVSAHSSVYISAQGFIAKI